MNICIQIDRLTNKAEGLIVWRMKKTLKHLIATKAEKKP